MTGEDIILAWRNLASTDTRRRQAAWHVIAALTLERAVLMAWDRSAVDDVAQTILGRLDRAVRRDPFDWPAPDDANGAARVVGYLDLCLEREFISVFRARKRRAESELPDQLSATSAADDLGPMRDRAEALLRSTEAAIRQLLSPALCRTFDELVSLRDGDTSIDAILGVGEMDEGYVRHRNSLYKRHERARKAIHDGVTDAIESGSVAADEVERVRVVIGSLARRKEGDS